MEYSRPADRIHIREILVRCLIGLNPDERIKKQDVLISLTLEGDLLEAGETDDINKTIDYKSLKNRVISFTEESSFLLIERLAHEIGFICLQHPRVEAVLVQLDKPGALRFAKSVAVEVYRTRDNYPGERFNG